ncbi:MAG: rhodanese-like domain-containing protein [Alphaproteobacteria bacterium]|nr:rhodanese-like domain-containing protein [Alphaproteobacteria bacterium]MCW5741879.1 rhodanese-like domain-containing protein [Alphaproteobacteria bacterium]
MFQKMKAMMGMGSPISAGTTVTPVEAHRRQIAGTLLIDVRHGPERAQVGAPVGAAWIDWTGDAQAFLAATRALTGGDTGRPIALICRSGIRSGQAQAVLQGAGYADVVNVVGGFDAGPQNWRASGLPEERV